jgi:hypothetical protein
MQRSWVSVVVGILAFLCIGLLVRQCGSKDPGSARERAAAEHFAVRDRSGGPGSPGGAGAVAGRRSSFAARDSSDDDAGADSGEPGSLRERVARARQRAMTAPVAGAPGLTGQPVARPDAGNLSGGSGHPGDLLAAEDAAEDEDGPDTPALDLKLDKSTVPEKGDTAPVVEQGITFERDGAYFGEDAVLAMPSTSNVEGTAGTISFWIQPDWAGETDTNAALFQWRTNTFENRIQIFKNGPFLRFLFCDNTGVESGVGYNIIHWKPGEWRAITATWGDSVTVLYIDGASVGARDYSGELLIPPGTPWYFGSDHAGGAPGARSRISGFQIFQRALHPDEVMMLVTRTRPAS